MVVVVFVFVIGKAGRKTLLLEKKKFPRDKFCGDAVCKTAIEILDEMGIYEQLLSENKARIVCCSHVLSFDSSFVINYFFSQYIIAN